MSQSSQLQHQTININVKSAKEIAQASKENLARPDSFLTKVFGEYEFNRFGIIAMLLLAVVCTAGVAVGTGAMTNLVEVGFLAVSTLACLTFVLAVAPMKLILYTGMVSVAISISIMIINLIIL